MSAGRRITTAASVPANGSVVFRVRDRNRNEVREAILVRANSGIVGWMNYCQHLIHIRLDKGRGVERRDDEIVCRNHGAMFEVGTGYCTHGPCEGAYLEGIDVEVDDDLVVLTDDRYEFIGTGPIETDPSDRRSTSNVEF